ncbi:hypothetical protein, partial [uncultured Hyphomicrobium sp.]|uniref:hypothetical protein n=1 Tax=uncultured Hyphomicrobium sp. TaxID=194373 RepID=UPI0026010260
FRGYNDLANRRLQPLGHVSARANILNFKDVGGSIAPFSRRSKGVTPPANIGAIGARDGV